MRARHLIAFMAVALLVLAPTALAAQERGNDSGQRADQDKVTGGGQVVADTEQPAQGAGDTLGFVARSTSNSGDAAEGQFTRVETSMTGQEGPTMFFGDVTCLTVDGDSAQFGGVERDSGQAFTVDVKDNGQGDDADADLIRFRETDEPCDDEEEPEQTLARGNLTIHSGSND